MRVYPLVPVLTRVNLNIRTLVSFSIGLMSIFSHSYAFANVGQQLSAAQTLTLSEANQHYIDKKYQSAIQLTKSIIQKAPENIAAKILQAQSLSKLNKHKQAIKLYQAVLEARPDMPEVYNNLASLYARQGELEVARQTLENGIATNKQYQTLYENLSAIYVEMARGAYSKALKLGVQAKAVQLKTLNWALPESRQALALNTSGNTAGISNNKKLVTQPAATQPQPAIQESKKTSEVKLASASLSKPKVVTKPEASVAVVQPASQTRTKTEFREKNAPTINKDEVITALQGWAAAWSAQAVDLYLSFYGKEFKPARLSRKVWAVQRRIRLSKPRWVNVRLKNFDVKAVEKQADKAIVRLVQDYRADNYQDKTRKQFVMKRTLDGWRILSEQSLAVIR